MPFCEECDRYWAPSAMNEDGSCPNCGTGLDRPVIAPDVQSEDVEKTPWHFKLMVVALVVYLGYRFGTMIF